MTVREVIERTADESGLSVESILYERKDARVIRARKEAMRRARVEVQASIGLIADVFGRSRATVLHAITGGHPFVFGLTT